MSVINSSALSLSRNIATHFSSRLQSVQQACSTLVRNICRIAPSQETLNKQVNSPRPAMSEPQQSLNNIYAQATPQQLAVNGSQHLLNTHLYEEINPQQQDPNGFQYSDNHLYEEVNLQQRASKGYQNLTDNALYEGADPQQQASNGYQQLADNALYEGTNPRQQASNEYQQLADNNIYEEIPSRLSTANSYQPLLNNGFYESVNPQHSGDNEYQQTLHEQISEQINAPRQEGGRLKNILQQYFMKHAPQQRAMKLEMREHQQMLNDFFFLQKQKAKENVQQHSDIYNIAQAQIDAVNRKNKDCGFYLTLDDIKGISMVPRHKHKATAPLDEKGSAKYEAMRMQRDSLNNLLFNEMRNNHVIFNGQSTLIDIINAQVKSLNSKLRNSGYQLNFNVTNGITMGRLPVKNK